MLTPTKLRCEYLTNPQGIGTTAPRFDWKLESDQPEARDQKQSAYQIIVASSEEHLTADKGDLWDSGQVKSDTTTQIDYAGAALASRARAYWKARSWNAAGQPGPWSQPALLSVGLLDSSDWKAKWIGYDAPLPGETAPSQELAETISLDGLTWVWCSEDPEATRRATTHPAGDYPAAGSYPAGFRYFRKVISIPAGKIEHAGALLTAEDRFELFINGSGAGFGSDPKRSWPLDLTKFLHAGENVIAICARNDRPGPAGILGRFRIKLEGQPTSTFDIDGTWLATQEKITGWETDKTAPTSAAWKNAETVAKLGDQPFGTPAVRTLTLPPPPYLRKAFAATKPIARATLYASALGLYEIHINDQRVGKDHFTPGWTEYTKRVQYQTYDVTSLVKSGDNAIGAILGDGWHSGYFGFMNKRNFYGGDPRLLVQLEIEYADGSREIVVTDNTWKAAYGPIREADLLMGCEYDANEELGAWSQAGYDDAKWQSVVIGESARAVQASHAATVQTIDELKPKSLKEPQPGAFVYDLGQNIVGWARLKLNTKPGQKLRIRYAERLNPDGSIYTTSLRAARATDSYTSKGGEIVWEPTFTFHGFQYVELTGVDSRPPMDAITGIVTHSQIDRTGTFECSNPLINKLVQNIIWGQKGNYFEAPTDCPQRDERLGWTGDAQFFIPTGAYNFDVAGFFRKWLIDLCEDSANDEGAFGSVAPETIRGRQSFGATAWADAGIICPYVTWKVYGDDRVIRDHYAAMTKYIGYLEKSSKNLIRQQGAYGDWLNLGGGAKSEVIGTAYFEYVTRLMAEMSDAIGKPEDAKKFRALADKVREVFIKEFILPDGTIKESSQTGYALAFAFDLIPAELRQKAADAFVEEIRKKDWHLATGFIGTPRLLPALSLAGRDDVAYRLLEQEGFPGWLFQVKLGATTMWERWDGWTPDKGFQDPGMNSFNHYAFGSVGEWLYRSVGGIDMASLGFQQIIIRPQPGGSLTWAKTGYDSIHGKIETAWKIEGKKISLDVTIPVNTTATIYVPTSDPKSATEAKGIKPANLEKSAAVYKVGSGRYHFTATR